MDARLCCALALAMLSVPATGLAQELHLVSVGVPDSAALARALSEDLARPVTEASDSPPLLLVSLADGTAVLRFIADDGVERQRTARVASDPEAATRELALLGSNLVRDEASALIAEVVSEPIAPAPAATLAEPALAVPPAPAPHFALESPLRLGAEAIFGVQVRDSEVQPIFDWGLSLFGTVHEAVAVGLTRFTIGGGYSSIEGTLFAVSGAPAVELFLFPDRHVQLYGQLGVSLQGRTPTNLRVGEFQAAPFLAAGARFWVVPWFSLSVQLAVHVTLTDAFLMGSLDLPRWSTPGTLGIGADFHMDP